MNKSLLKNSFDKSKQIFFNVSPCNELSNHADCIDLISLFYNVWRKNVGADCLVVVCYVNKEDDVAGHLNQV